MLTIYNYALFVLFLLRVLFNVTNPPLRYYVAEGVRLYSQETWRVVTQTGERNQHINKFTSEWVHDCIAVRPCSIVMCNVPFYPLLTFSSGFC